jgi:ankyrin repeat protein
MMLSNFTKHIKIVVYLIVFIGNINANAGSFEDFFIAIKQDNPDTIATLINRGFDANTRNPAGEPSLKVVITLLSWPKIDVEARNLQDESPLMMACIKGYVELSKQLIARGADVNKPGWAPLHYAATKGHIELINLLLDNHAYIDASSPNGSTPLMMAAMYGTPSAVKLLLESGADPLIKNNLGMTAIDFAQRDNRADSAEIIAAFVRGKLPKGKW